MTKNQPGTGSSPEKESVPAEMILSSGLREFLLYFLRLGTLGFGGPIALAGYMQRDLVEIKRGFRNKIISKAWRSPSALRDHWRRNSPFISAGFARASSARPCFPSRSSCLRS